MDGKLLDARALSAPLLIADVPWLLYRSYFALPKSIVDAEGRPVNALLGTVNAVLSLFDEARLPARGSGGVVACMGAEQADYRVALYPAYHAHRDPMPPELAAQWEKAPELLESLGWTFATSADLEADDVMFSFARAEEEAGGEALLLTGDRDLFAAVSDHVAVVELGKGGAHGEIGPEQVRERYGVGPELVADFIALRGDPSDGLPGAPGIGAKTAAELLRAHGSLKAVLTAAGASANAADSAAAAVRASTVMRPRIAAALRENAELLRTFKQIATLQRIDVQRPRDRATDFAGGARVAREMGMRRLAERLDKLA
ncbi:MAG TPA: 5'-3' exonuclease H3TH domain-containing protein [Solirubrobacteraceae bacterium]|nr:5'-3' exonuclease H3TH domain-containing protein [Solirubrobacteraceae bacterium]